MMWHFDLRTAYLLTGILYLVLPILTLIALSKSLSKQIILWTMGSFLLGISLMLLSQLLILPSWITLNIVPIIMMISHSMRIQSLRMDLGKPIPLKWIVLFLVPSILVLQMIYLDDFIRAVFLMPLFAIMFGFLSLTAWNLAKSEDSLNARLIAVVYLLVALALVYRLVNILFLAACRA